MKINKRKDTEIEKSISFDEVVKNLIHKYKTIFMEEIDDEIYLYKPLSRKYYKEVIQNPNLDDFQKEEEVCIECILWPENIDWDEVDAGVPTQLYEIIMEQSCLASLNDIADLIDINKEDLDMFDIQMSCIISEAFPNYDIEEIESWDMLRLCKMFTRAEWKMRNLRNMQTIDVAEKLRDIFNNNNKENKDYDNTIKKSSNYIESDDEYNSKTYTPIDESINKKYKVGNRLMDEKEYREFEKFKREYPDIDFGADSMFTGFESHTIDTTNPGLRTPR